MHTANGRENRSPYENNSISFLIFVDRFFFSSFLQSAHVALHTQNSFVWDTFPPGQHAITYCTQMHLCIIVYYGRLAQPCRSNEQQCYISLFTYNFQSVPLINFRKARHSTRISMFTCTSIREYIGSCFHARSGIFVIITIISIIIIILPYYFYVFFITIITDHQLQRCCLLEPNRNKKKSSKVISAPQHIIYVIVCI